MSVEIRNIGVVSVIFLLVWVALSPARSELNTSLADSGSHIPANLGDMAVAVFSIASIPATLTVPLLRRYLSYKVLILGTALFHIGLYVGMIFVNEVVILVGAAITGAANGMISALVPEYVTVISQFEMIERNLSYSNLVINVSGIVGNLMNYLCLGGVDTITSNIRIKVYSVCIAVTVFSVVLGLFGMRPIRAQPTNELSANPGSNRLIDSFIPDSRPTFARFISFTMEQTIIDVTVCRAVVGVMAGYQIGILSCISSTYSEVVIPAYCLVYGATRTLSNASFYRFTRTFGFSTLLHWMAAINFVWLLVMLSVFPADSLYSSKSRGQALLPAGPWVIYPIAVLTGIVTSINAVLVTVASGKIAASSSVMHGFEPSAIFAWGFTVYNASQAATLALLPYMNLYLLLFISFVGVLAQYYVFLNNILSYLTRI